MEPIVPTEGLPSVDRNMLARLGISLLLDSHPYIAEDNLSLSFFSLVYDSGGPDDAVDYNYDKYLRMVFQINSSIERDECEEFMSVTRENVTVRVSMDPSVEDPVSIVMSRGRQQRRKMD